MLRPEDLTDIGNRFASEYYPLYADDLKGIPELVGDQAISKADVDEVKGRVEGMLTERFEAWRTRHPELVVQAFSLPPLPDAATEKEAEATHRAKFAAIAAEAKERRAEKASAIESETADIVKGGGAAEVEIETFLRGLPTFTPSQREQLTEVLFSRYLPEIATEQRQVIGRSLALTMKTLKNKLQVLRAQKV